MKNDENLRPCPYCGGNAEVEKVDGFYTVICLLCEYKIPYGFPKRDVVRTWNIFIIDDVEGEI